MIPISVFRCGCFAEKYGLEIADGPLKGLEARAVIILDEEGTIVYEEVVDEISQEPNYEKALEVLRK